MDTALDIFAHPPKQKYIMKQYNRIALANLAAVLGMLPLTAKAVVIVNDAVLTRRSATEQSLIFSSSFALFSIRVDAISASSFEFHPSSIAEEIGLFNVTLGTVFGPEFALANGPIVSNDGTDPRTSTQVFTLNQSKYFGYWDDGLNGNSPDSSDHYGWVKITRTASGLEASSSATAIGGGIIVGTTNQIPEPSASLLLAFLLGVSLARRVTRQRSAS